MLRWVENPRDTIAAFRAIQLLPGIGSAAARNAINHLSGAGWDFASLSEFSAPAVAVPYWADLCGLLYQLRKQGNAWVGQVAQARHWYQTHLERLYDNVTARSGDLDQLEQIAATHSARASFLSELTLDRPETSSAEAGPPHLDEDYLVLSTIHSAKGRNGMPCSC